MEIEAEAGRSEANVSGRTRTCLKSEARKGSECNVLKDLFNMGKGLTWVQCEEVDVFKINDAMTMMIICFLFYSKIRHDV